MASKYWIKLYHEILEDPKIGTLSDRLWRRTIEMFLLAGIQGDAGWLPTIKNMAWLLRMSEEILETDLVDLAKTGIVEQMEGRWFIPKFEERQGPSPVKQRVDEYRKRQRHETVEKRLCNDDVTKRYTKVTPDTDTDTDIPPTEVAEKTRQLSTKQQFIKELSLYFEEVTGIPWVEPRNKSDWADAQVGWLKPLDKIANYAKWKMEKAKWLLNQALSRAAGSYTVSQPKSIEKEVAAIVGEMSRGQYKETRHTMTDEQFKQMLRARVADD